jgi:hypothetical protein
VEVLTNRLDQVEVRLLQLEDKVDRLEHWDKDKEKIRKYKQNRQSLGDAMKKIKPRNYRHGRRGTRKD